MAASTFADRYNALSNQDPYIQSVIRPGQTLAKKMPFEYGVTIGNAATPLTVAAGPVSVPMTTLADSDFALTAISACVQVDANSDMKFNRNLTLQIQDTSTGKFFFNAPTVMALAVGGGGFPLILAAPRVIRPNSTLLVTAQNRDTGSAYLTMFVTFAGTRLFYAS